MYNVYNADIIIVAIHLLYSHERNVISVEDSCDLKRI